MKDIVHFHKNIRQIKIQEHILAYEIDFMKNFVVLTNKNEQNTQRYIAQVGKNVVKIRHHTQGMSAQKIEIAHVLVTSFVSYILKS